MSYKVIALPAAVAEAVRSTMCSPDYGYPAYREVATGTGPCRSCLRPFAVGKEERILFTYQPFDRLGLPSPGPVFIHARPCVRYEGSSIPPELRSIPLVVEGFSEDGQSLGRLAVGERDPDQVIVERFIETGVDYLHLRHGEAGCFIARIEPARIHALV
jgi:Protein of unknown function (DUF1203)